jgi:hypothetical protein
MTNARSTAEADELITTRDAIEVRCVNEPNDQSNAMNV